MAPWKAVPVKQEELEDTTTSTRHVVKPPSAAEKRLETQQLEVKEELADTTTSTRHVVKSPSAAAAARASGYGSTAKKAKTTTAKASQTRPPAVHSAEHQWQSKLSRVKDVAEQVGLKLSHVWPKTGTFGGLGMCILTVESHQGSALWCHCCNHWLSGDIKHHSLHSKHIEYILAWSRETALQMLLHGMLLQKVACSKGQWTKKELKDKEKTSGTRSKGETSESSPCPSRK